MVWRIEPFTLDFNGRSRAKLIKTESTQGIREVNVTSDGSSFAVIILPVSQVLNERLLGEALGLTEFNAPPHHLAGYYEHTKEQVRAFLTVLQVPDVEITRTLDTLESMALRGEPTTEAPAATTRRTVGWRTSRAMSELRRSFNRTQMLEAIANDLSTHSPRVAFHRPTRSATENSMESLSALQLELFAKLQSKYTAVLEQRGGVDAVIQGLVEHLSDLYNAQPMTYSVNGKDLELPLKWGELQNLLRGRSEVLQQDILKLYYQNYIHTAYRYFLKPNQWIAPNSQWASGIRGTGNPRWADFDKYTKEIAYLWLAASDPTEAVVDKMSVSERQLFFISHLALTNRGHNMDNDQDRDDLRGDDPSCHMGVLTRVFAGLREHSLLSFPVEDVVKLQVVAFYQEYYRTILKSLKTEDFEKIIAGEFVAELNKKLTDSEIAVCLEDVKAQLQRSQYETAMIPSVIDKVKEQLNTHSIVTSQDPVELHFNKHFTDYGLQKIYDAEAKLRSPLKPSSTGPRPG